MEYKYCITHEKEEAIFVGNGYPIEYHYQGGGVCEGPFASCPPPVLPEDWNTHVTEPSLNELMVMDIHAEEILAEM